jgi:transposase
MVRGAGHVPLRRPPYAPESAPIEQAFHWIKTYLRRYKYDVTDSNLGLWIARAIRAMTVTQIRGFFRNSGYH